MPKISFCVNDEKDWSWVQKLKAKLKPHHIDNFSRVSISVKIAGWMGRKWIRWGWDIFSCPPQITFSGDDAFKSPALVFLISVWLKKIQIGHKYFVYEKPHLSNRGWTNVYFCLTILKLFFLSLVPLLFSIPLCGCLSCVSVCLFVSFTLCLFVCLSIFLCFCFSFCLSLSFHYYYSYVFDV